MPIRSGIPTSRAGSVSPRSYPFSATYTTASMPSAPTAPRNPVSMPSSMNGRRTNAFVAPTSFITSISRRREKIESRIVFWIRTTAATPSRIINPNTKYSTYLSVFSTRSVIFLPYVTHGGLPQSRIGVIFSRRRRRTPRLVRVGQLHVERRRKRIRGRIAGSPACSDFDSILTAAAGET